MTRTTLRPKGQITLPAGIRDALHVEDGDEIEFELAPDGRVLMSGLKMIPAEQAWFWTDRGKRESGRRPLSLRAEKARYSKPPRTFSSLSTTEACLRSNAYLASTPIGTSSAKSSRSSSRSL